MKVQNSYLIKTINDVIAWLAVNKEIPSGATIIEERPMLMPDDGMILRNKETGEESSGHWMRGEDSADKWEEIEEPKEDVNG